MSGTRHGAAHAPDSCDLCATGTAAARPQALLPQTWLARCRAQPEQVAMRHKRRGIWLAVRWADHLERTRALALALDRCGLAVGEVVSILSESRPEWVQADMAAQAMGMVSHGLYPTRTAADVADELRLAGTRLVFVQDCEQAAKVLEGTAALPRLRRLVVFDERGIEDLGDSRVVGLRAFVEDGRAHPDPALFEQRIAALDAGRIALLASSAGSSGTARLAAITHGAAALQAARVHAATNPRPGDRTLAFVPLANAAERMFSMALPLLSDMLVHFPESPGTVLNDLCEVQPHWVHAPPRFWEKLRSRTETTALQSSPFSRRLFERGVHGAGGGWIEAAARRQLRRMLGLQRVRIAYTGGAAAAPRVLQFYAAIGVPMRDLYESAETCGPCLVLAQAPDAAHDFGGSARVAPDGELLVRHESMLAGYWNEGALEAPPMTQAHWLRTGDRAEIDAQGGAHIAGRALEKALHGSIYIAASLVLSDGQDSRGCLLALEECSVLGYAQSHGIPFTDYANLVSRPEIQQLVGEQIAGINATLHEGAPIGRYRILPRLLHAEDEVMTPALRMRPLAAERHFERDIEALFSR